MSRFTPLGARLAAAGAALAVTCALTAGTAQATEDRETYPVGGVGTALKNYALSPDKVAGANDWNCKPSGEHRKPVVLVHGTFFNSGANWVALSPMLANAGYCVFTFNYGMHPLLSLNRVGGLKSVASSGEQMKAFVDKVLKATGAQEVDVVGHSQGGLVANYYLKRLGGADKVDVNIGLAPSNHGTTLSGLTTLAEKLHLLGFVNGLFDFAGTQGVKDQIVDSDFQRELFADGDTVPGVRYVVVATTKDWVVTPYKNAFLQGAGVENITLQDQCPDDPASHIGLFNDSPTLQNVLNELGPDVPDFKPECKDYGLVL
ncbi:esterase/lipase family protein [Streptomyces physcomitrii]|uniref:Alpha/beta fold hydrolase n=1 Tax=Streptomyces physcomitrii TaxID=2724184 RepID=A0ABX1H0H2_9ACTN|nr:alpha/beta fold hydrolase [Streptomyces physcomitrii]NKI40814.1 alpha/beta fold hydrolase [Streptomyces physcomitrii]